MFVICSSADPHLQRAKLKAPQNYTEKCPLSLCNMERRTGETSGSDDMEMVVVEHEEEWVDEDLVESLLHQASMPKDASDVAHDREAALDAIRTMRSIMHRLAIDVLHYPPERIIPQQGHKLAPEVQSPPRSVLPPPPPLDPLPEAEAETPEMKPSQSFEESVNLPMTWIDESTGTELCGDTPLISAVREGRLELVKFLLLNQACPWFISSLGGRLQTAMDIVNDNIDEQVFEDIQKLIWTALQFWPPNGCRSLLHGPQKIQDLYSVHTVNHQPSSHVRLKEALNAIRLPRPSFVCEYCKTAFRLEAFLQSHLKNPSKKCLQSRQMISSTI